MVPEPLAPDLLALDPAHAALAAARRAARARDMAASVEWAERAARLAGPREAVLQHAILLLLEAGDRAAAHRVYQNFNRAGRAGGH